MIRYYRCMPHIVLACALALAGCQQAMTNDEIIAEVKKCEAADMDAQLMSSMASLDMVSRVECRMKKAVKP